jgi:hypothetical protein
VDLTDVQHRIQAIADVAGDYERAHGLEDSLFGDALTTIAAASADLHARALAGAALASTEINFQRLAA